MIPTVAPFESCVVCLKGDVGTGLAFVGSPEFHAAGLIAAGVPHDQAVQTIEAFPSDDEARYVRLCRTCADRCGLPIAEMKDGQAVPAICQRDLV